MKSRDLIKQLVREDMPDLEQVRENCHTQAILQGRKAQRLRWSAAVAVTACLMIVTVVYAASVIIDRFDTGGTMQFIPVAYDSPQLQAQRESMIMSLPIYANNRSDISPRFMQLNPQEYMAYIWGFDGFSAEDAQVINDMLAEKIFTADGEPFVLMTAIPNQNLYRADDRHNILFNENGHEIGIIRIAATWEGEFVWADILTRTEFEEMFRYAAAYHEGAALLGQHFRLPTVHTEKFNSPSFRLEYWTEPETGEHIRRVIVRYMEGDAAHNDLIIVVETTREEMTEPLSTLYTAAEITKIEIAGITVAKMTYAGYSSTFSWIYDDLVYNLLPPSGVFTDGELEEIIESMLIQTLIP